MEVIELSKAFKQLSHWQSVLLLNFVQETGLMVYSQWVQSGKDADIEDVIQTTINLLQGGIQAFLSDDLAK